jgi:hypothetical protein
MAGDLADATVTPDSLTRHGAAFARWSGSVAGSDFPASGSPERRQPMTAIAAASTIAA